MERLLGVAMVLTEQITGIEVPAALRVTHAGDGKIARNG